MTRYETQTWKQLEAAQNAPENMSRDILTITAMMSDEQFEAHAARYIKPEPAQAEANWAAAELVRLLKLGRSVDSVRVQNLMQIIDDQTPNHNP